MSIENRTEMRERIPADLPVRRSAGILLCLQKIRDRAFWPTCEKYSFLTVQSIGTVTPFFEKIEKKSWKTLDIFKKHNII